MITWVLDIDRKSSANNIRWRKSLGKVIRRLTRVKCKLFPSFWKTFSIFASLLFRDRVIIVWTIISGSYWLVLNHDNYIRRWCGKLREIPLRQRHVKNRFAEAQTISEILLAYLREQTLSTLLLINRFSPYSLQSRFTPPRFCIRP